MIADSLTHPQAGTSHGSTSTASESRWAEAFRIGADGCPHLKVARDVLLLESKMALGYRDLGCRPVALIEDNGSLVPAVKCGPFQRRAPTTEEVVN